MPLGSWSEYTKQLNAARKSSPHGPCAIPPRHGQSQFISPVTGSNAADAGSSSSSSTDSPSSSPRLFFSEGSLDDSALGLSSEDAVVVGCEGVGDDDATRGSEDFLDCVCVDVCVDNGGCDDVELDGLFTDFAGVDVELTSFFGAILPSSLET